MQGKQIPLKLLQLHKENIGKGNILKKEAPETPKPLLTGTGHS